MKSVCRTEKIVFETEAEAEAKIKEVLARYPLSKPQNCYRCRYCLRYHLSSNDESNWVIKQPGKRVRGAKAAPWKGNR